MESSNSKILDNILEQRGDCIRRRKMEEENETYALEEVVSALRQREVELEKEFEKRVEKLEVAYQGKAKQLEEAYQKKVKILDDDYNTKMDNFEKEKETMAKLNKIQDEIIKLNIGGHKFTTSLQTLRSDHNSMLGVMFSGRHPIMKQGDRSIFIDRDGRHFHLILNYLRGTISSAEQLSDDRIILSDLSTEAEYYQLQGLIDIIKPKRKEKIAINQSEFNQYFLACADGWKETVGDTSFRNHKLDNITLDQIDFTHSLDLSDCSLVNCTLSICNFFAGNRYSFDGADLKNCKFLMCNNMKELVKTKEISFYNVKNFHLAIFDDLDLQQEIKKAFGL